MITISWKKLSVKLSHLMITCGKKNKQSSINMQSVTTYYYSQTQTQPWLRWVYRSFTQGKCYLCSAVSITSLYFVHDIKCACLWFKIYLGIWAKIGPNMNINDTPNWKPNSFNKLGKYVNFGTDVIDSILYTLQPLELASGLKLYSATWNYFHRILGG